MRIYTRFSSARHPSSSSQGGYSHAMAAISFAVLRMYECLYVHVCICVHVGVCARMPGPGRVVETKCPGVGLASQ